MFLNGRHKAENKLTAVKQCVNWWVILLETQQSLPWQRLKSISFICKYKMQDVFNNIYKKLMNKLCSLTLSIFALECWCRNVKVREGYGSVNQRFHVITPATRHIRADRPSIRANHRRRSLASRLMNMEHLYYMLDLTVLFYAPW
jgi:hypothetical protein